MAGQPAIFLDRDGTILKEVPYLSTPSKAKLLRGVAETLARLHDAGVLLIVVSNQSGVARGLLNEGDLVNIQKKIESDLKPSGAKITAWYHCPHHNTVGIQPQRRRCRCRKPLPGLIEMALADFDIDLERSAGVGDDVRDLQAFAAIGIPAVLVGTGKGRIARQKLAEQGRDPDLYCAHLAEALTWMLRQTSSLQTP